MPPMTPAAELLELRAMLQALADASQAHLAVLQAHSARLDLLPGPGLLARLRWLLKG